MKDADAPDGEALAEAAAVANIPTLIPVLVQLTGDLGWLEPPYAPSRPRGLDDNDDGGLPESVQGEIRDAARAALKRWAATGGIAIPEPDEALLVRMLSVAMGEPIPAEYGAMLKAGLGLSREAPPETRLRGRAPEGFRAVVIGSGMSGLCAAVRLKAAGIPFTVLEAGDDVGGTWRENRYPGAGVDTPNHLYSFSFQPHDWRHYFSLQPEIEAYFRRVAEDQGVLEHVRFRTRATTARFDEEACRWRVETEAGETFDADLLVSAVGVLNLPKVPPIPGLESFPGPAFHTAEWPEGLALAGKRVAVVGNGASAMQIVPAIADEVASLTVHARSKQWAAPFPQFRKAVPEPVRRLLMEVPLYQAWYRQRLAWAFNDKLHSSLQKDPDWDRPERSLNAQNEAHRRVFEAYVKAELGERQDLLPKVLPDYPPFGKRMLLDNGWYRTVARPHVELFDERLAEVRGATLVSESGEAREADVLVLATGFRATAFLASLDVVGRGGRRLADEWGEGDARAHLGTFVPGYPNLVTLLGPNVGLGHGGSVIAPVEAQMDLVLSALEGTFAAGARAVDVKAEAHAAYNAKVDAAHDRMVWTHPGTDNWYRNEAGRVVAITPWRHDDWWRMTRRPDLTEFELLGAG